VINTSNNPINQYYQSITQFKIKNCILGYSALIGLLGYLFIGLFAPPSASALTMSNDNFMIQMSTLDMAGGSLSGTNYKLGFSAGETAPGQFSGPNYKVKSGFEYIRTPLPFSFSISQTLIDFGVLTPTNPVIRTNTLTVANGSAFGYSVEAFENHPLQTVAPLAFIPDTTCDDGTCNEKNPSAWATTLTYGFGYRCDNILGTDCNPIFANPNFYRQFSDESHGEVPQQVMHGTKVSTNKTSQITYKVNISGTQASGLYSNVITYIATPTF